MNCRANATVKAIRYDIDVSRSMKTPSYFLIPSGTRTVKVPIVKTKFKTKTDFFKSNSKKLFKEMYTSDISAMYESVRNYVFENGTVIKSNTKFPLNLDVIFLKHTKHKDATGQIQISESKKGFVQLDFYENDTSKPSLIVVCDVSKELPVPVKSIPGIGKNYSPSDFARKIATLFVAAEKYNALFPGDESTYCTADLNIPREFLSYWKG